MDARWSIGVIGAVGLFGAALAHAAPRASAPEMAQQEGHRMVDRATFAAGCFWGVESMFRQVPGVVDTAVGYTGGTTKNPTYEQVCRHDTGHAEAVQVDFDPSQVNYERLLEIFWDNHNPTTPNRQGPDRGSQYRSAVFYSTPEQQAAAEAMKARLDKSRQFSAPIVTEIVPVGEFYRAEEYHQRYHEKHGGQCHINLGGKSTKQPAHGQP